VTGLRRTALWLATGAAAVLLCAGCRAMSGSTAVPPAPATVTGTDSAGDQAGSQLDQLQSTLDSVQAQVNADSAP
jgi:hypothetical protein